MIPEAALITASCVLFVQMGLSGAIQERLKLKLRILSCPKCLSFWSVLAWMIFSGHGLIRSVAASFLCAYAALWSALVLDGLAALYDWLYEQITETTDASPDAQTGRPDDPAPAPDEVS